jgi:hypothetical protein
MMAFQHHVLLQTLHALPSGGTPHAKFGVCPIMPVSNMPAKLLLGVFKDG